MNASKSYLLAFLTYLLLFSHNVFSFSIKNYSLPCYTLNVFWQKFSNNISKHSNYTIKLPNKNNCSSFQVGFPLNNKNVVIKEWQILGKTSIKNRGCSMRYKGSEIIEEICKKSKPKIWKKIKCPKNIPNLAHISIFPKIDKCWHSQDSYILTLSKHHLLKMKNEWSRIRSYIAKEFYIFPNLLEWNSKKESLVLYYRQ